MATHSEEAERAGHADTGRGASQDLAPGAARVARVALPAVLVGFALALRLVGLDHPDRLFFDEVYYAEDAWWLLRQGVEDGFVVHPPVGKWLIALGIAVAGFEPFGWRLAPAIAGSLLVGAVYLCGLRLLGRPGLATLAALLVAVDGLALSMSRIAMLDIFVALFVVGAAWLLLVDRDRMAGQEGAAPGRPPPARWGAGALLGLAVATKWPALLALGAAAGVVIAAEAARRRRSGSSALARPGAYLATVALPLAVLPAAIYLASYAGWFANFADTGPGARTCESRPCEAGPGERLAAWAAEQRQIARFHLRLEAEHRYRSSAWTWPVMGRPVVHYFETCREDRDPAEGPCEVRPGHAALIVGVGNPVLWWPALAAYPVLAWAALRRRDRAAGWLLAFLLGQYVPWLIAARPSFFYYATPVVPFVALALAWLVGRARPQGRILLTGALAFAALTAAWFWLPVWVGSELPGDAWRARMLFSAWY